MLNEKLHAVVDSDLGSNTIKKIKKYLLAGADGNARDSNSSTPLHKLCKRIKSIEIVLEALEILIVNGADVNLMDKDANTALDIAIRSNQPRLVKLLINAKADVDTHDQYKQTPLFLAITHTKNKEIVKLLIDANVNVNQANPFGKTPLNLAIEYKLKEIEKLLINAGAKIVATENPVTQVVPPYVETPPHAFGYSFGFIAGLKKILANCNPIKEQTAQLIPQAEDIDPATQQLLVLGDIAITTQPHSNSTQLFKPPLKPANDSLVRYTTLENLSPNKITQFSL